MSEAPPMSVMTAEDTWALYQDKIKAEALVEALMRENSMVRSEAARLRSALGEIRDGLADTPNCQHDPDINIAIDALYTYADSILNPKP